MNLVPIKKDEFAGIKRDRMGNNIAFITEFINADTDVAEVTNYTHKSPYSCATALKQAFASMNVGVSARVINGKVYLIKGVE